jgi:hypothetical protein
MVARKREDTAAGCRELAQDDEARAAASASDHMRDVLNRSAEAWSERAKLLARLEGDFAARAGSFAGKRAQPEAGSTDNG